MKIIVEALGHSVETRDYGTLELGNLIQILRSAQFNPTVDESAREMAASLENQVSALFDIVLPVVPS